MLHAFANDSFQSIDLTTLDSISGGKFDVNRMVDNGNRWGAAGAALGGGGGAVVGGVLGLPGGPPGVAAGAATGAGIGAGLVGAAGWVGGAGVDAWNQVRGR
jgi:hypothetical protein